MKILKFILFIIILASLKLFFKFLWFIIKTIFKILFFPFKLIFKKLFKR